MGFSVAIEEVAPYPQGPGWTQTDRGWRFQATRCLDMDWDSLQTFCQELNTYPNNCFPYSWGTELALARRIRPQGIGRTGGSGNEISYDRAHVFVDYDTIGPMYSPGSMGDYVDEWTNIGNAGYNFHPETGKAYWSSDSTAVDTKQVIEVPSGQLQYIRTFYRVLEVPTAVYSLVGYANASIVPTYTLGLSFGAGTLQYLGARVSSTADLGQVEYKVVSEVFAYSSHGWNSWWHQGYGWDNIKDADGNSFVPHLPGNFSLLG